MEGIRLGGREVDLNRAVVRNGPTVQSLTRLEVRLLQTLLSRSGRPLSVDDALRSVWGYRAGIQSRAVTLLVSRLRKKIEPDPTSPRYLVSAYGQGYRLIVPRTHSDITALVAEVERLVERIDGPAPRAALDEMEELLPVVQDALTVADINQEASLRIGIAALDEYRSESASVARLMELAEQVTQPELSLGCWRAALRVATKTGLPEVVEACPDVPLDQPSARLRRLALEIQLQRTRLGRPTEEDFLALVARARTLGDRVLEALILDRLATLVRRRDVDYAHQLWSDALQILGRDDRYQAPILNNVAISAFQRGDTDTATEFAHRAILAFERHGLPGRAALACCNLGSIRLAAGDVPGAREAVARGFALGGGPDARLPIGHIVRARAAILSGDLAGVGPHLHLARFCAERAGEAHLVQIVERTTGWLDLMEGRVEIGVQRLDAAAAALAAMGDTTSAAFATWQAAFMRGDPTMPPALAALGLSLTAPAGSSWVDLVATRWLLEGITPQ